MFTLRQTSEISERRWRRMARRLSMTQWADVLEPLPEPMRAAVASAMWFNHPHWQWRKQQHDDRLARFADAYKHGTPQPDDHDIFNTADRLAATATQRPALVVRPNAIWRFRAGAGARRSMVAV